MCACMLCVKGDSFEPEEYCSNSKLPIYSMWKKGDLRSPHSQKRYELSGFSCEVSLREELKEQVEDAIAFLKLYDSELHEVSLLNGIEVFHLDFGYECRINMTTVCVQGEYLPPELLVLAGKHGIGVALSLYPPMQNDVESASI